MRQDGFPTKTKSGTQAQDRNSPIQDSATPKKRRYTIAPIRAKETSPTQTSPIEPLTTVQELPSASFDDRLSPLFDSSVAVVAVKKPIPVRPTQMSLQQRKEKRKKEMAQQSLIDRCLDGIVGNQLQTIADEARAASQEKIEEKKNGRQIRLVQLDQTSLILIGADAAAKITNPKTPEGNLINEILDVLSLPARSTSETTTSVFLPGMSGFSQSAEMSQMNVLHAMMMTQFEIVCLIEEIVQYDPTQRQRFSELLTAELAVRYKTNTCNSQGTQSQDYTTTALEVILLKHDNAFLWKFLGLDTAERSAKVLSNPILFSQLEKALEIRTRNIVGNPRTLFQCILERVVYILSPQLPVKSDTAYTETKNTLLRSPHALITDFIAHLFSKESNYRKQMDRQAIAGILNMYIELREKLKPTDDIDLEFAKRIEDKIFKYMNQTIEQLLRSCDTHVLKKIQRFLEGTEAMSFVASFPEKLFSLTRPNKEKRSEEEYIAMLQRERTPFVSGMLLLVAGELRKRLTELPTLRQPRGAALTLFGVPVMESRAGSPTASPRSSAQRREGSVVGSFAKQPTPWDRNTSLHPTWSTRFNDVGSQNPTRSSSVIGSERKSGFFPDIKNTHTGEGRTPGSTCKSSLA